MSLNRFRIAAETLGIIVILVGLKLGIEKLGLEFITLNPLFTSMIAGGIFLFGLILAGTLADYKESEKIPTEIVAACASIFHEGRFTKETKPEFDLAALAAVLGRIMEGFRVDAVKSCCSRTALAALEGLSGPFLEMERLGVPPNYIVRLKTEEGAIRKALLRMYYIQKTNFLPSAYVLVQSIVVLVMGLLLFTKIEPFYDSVIVLGFLTYLFVYILKLLKTLDTPFQESGRSMDDVSLFQLKEFQARMDEIEER
ncbi:MAG: hypothetical protein WAO58_01815 [Fimbriimonadaceae bacterium]